MRMTLQMTLQINASIGNGTMQNYLNSTAPYLCCLQACGATTTSGRPACTTQKPIRISVIASWPFIHGGYEDCASTYVCDLPRGICGLKFNEKNRTESGLRRSHASRPRRVADDEQTAMAHFASPRVLDELEAHFRQPTKRLP
jgi:hypothetical protein